MNSEMSNPYRPSLNDAAADRPVGSLGEWLRSIFWLFVSLSGIFLTSVSLFRLVWDSRIYANYGHSITLVGIMIAVVSFVIARASLK